MNIFIDLFIFKLLFPKIFPMVIDAGGRGGFLAVGFTGRESIRIQRLARSQGNKEGYRMKAVSCNPSRHTVCVFHRAKQNLRSSSPFTTAEPLQMFLSLSVSSFCRNFTSYFQKVSLAFNYILLFLQYFSFFNI